MYLAPEIVMGNSDIRSDNWSLGVFLYILISGKYPFKGRGKKDTLTSIFHGVFSFDHPAFHKASEDVKDLITRLLTRNPNERCTAYHAYHHDWVQRKIDEEDLNIQIDQDVIDRLHDFEYYNE